MEDAAIVLEEPAEEGFEPLAEQQQATSDSLADFDASESDLEEIAPEMPPEIEALEGFVPAVESGAEGISLEAIEAAACFVSALKRELNPGGGK